MYWAVQGMGAELVTGIVPGMIANIVSGYNLRMYVTDLKGKFIKLAYGRIYFTTRDIEKAI